MSEDIDSVNILVRREIEALITVPILQAFIEAFGKEKTLEITRNVIGKLAKDSGKKLAEVAGGNRLKDVMSILPIFSQGGALEFEPPETDSGTVRINITRCAYAEMYHKHGLKEFGFLMSCHRDYALFEGFSPNIELKRTQTIMEGADYCDFCLSESQKEGI